MSVDAVMQTEVKIVLLGAEFYPVARESQAPITTKISAESGITKAEFVRKRLLAQGIAAGVTDEAV